MSGEIFQVYAKRFMDFASDALGKIFIKQNLTSLANGTNETEKFKATPEGLFIAYTSLLAMALIPIILGSFKSVKHQKKQQVRAGSTCFGFISLLAINMH